MYLCGPTQRAAEGLRIGWVTIAEMNNMTKSKLGRKGFILLILLYLHSLSKEVRAGNQIGPELGGRS